MSESGDHAHRFSGAELKKQTNAQTSTIQKFILPRRGWLIEKIYAAFPHLASRISLPSENTSQLDGWIAR